MSSNGSPTDVLGANPKPSLREEDHYWLDPPELIELVRLGPLVSIDLVIRDSRGRTLVGLRSNEPARDLWFVPGGRVGKDETLDEAFARIAMQELGVTVHRRDARFLGVFEHFYDTNFLERAGVSTHYVALPHAFSLPGGDAEIRLDGQHRSIRWITEEELATDPRVHPNTRAYAGL